MKFLLPCTNQFWSLAWFYMKLQLEASYEGNFTSKQSPNCSTTHLQPLILVFYCRGLINDCLYAETYSRSRWSSSSWGPRRIRQVNLTLYYAINCSKYVFLVYHWQTFPPLPQSANFIGPTDGAVPPLLCS